MIVVPYEEWHFNLLELEGPEKKVIENYGNLYKFLTGKSQKAPYHYKTDKWNWQDDWDRDDIF